MPRLDAYYKKTREKSLKKCNVGRKSRYASYFYAVARVPLKVLKCDERWHKCADGRHSMNARESRNSRGTSVESAAVAENEQVAWATCQTNICKVEERRKSFAAENRCNIVSNDAGVRA